MSPENVEIVRRALDAWNSRDNDTALSLVDPEIEVEINLNFPIDGIYRGLDSLAKFMTEFWGQFETYRTDLLECIPAGEEVVTKVHHHGTGRGSGVEVEMLNWQVFTFRDGRILRWRNFNTRERALKAAGLSESAMSPENVEIVRAAWDAWNRGDWDEWRSYLSPDFELDTSSALGEWRGVYRGIDQVERAMQQFREPWKSVRIEIDELIDAGEHVVQRGTGHYVGRDGMAVQAGGAFCWTFRDGVIIRGLFSNDFDEALEAAGLSE